ncbi:hypothetical protein UFOVP784_69 [uncultured Caudovirales phage]|uniref:Uncharacterized protein n=1 Tax=uncultured Caudovirales phage TaxID=2100421 RepID=A0A6J5MA64_9CAUD|nr:hypothetical protein UFOVP436_69 [uncultured Caudovirales phage]CAB4162596.1 hypothetical protein UFOVP784_69 [uncultured Caudovirales phage]
MSEEVNVSEAKKEFKIEVSISEANVSYKSDFPESDTVFWLEWVKNVILQKTLSSLTQEGN